MGVSHRTLWGAHRAPRPLEYMVVVCGQVWVRSRLPTWCVVCMKLHELPDVFRSLPHEIDALGEIVTGFIAFFSTSASQGFRVLVTSIVNKPARLAACGEASTPPADHIASSRFEFPDSPCRFEPPE